MKRASVLIIGGGVMGCSVAYHLAMEGMKDIILLEKDSIASKATGICPGGIRQQWSSEIGCILARASVKFFENLDEELAPEIPLRFIQSGYLFLALSSEALNVYKRNVALQNRLGIPSRIVTVEEINELVPGINSSGLLGGAYCSEDGFLEDCYGFANVLAARAKEMGVRVIYDEALGIIQDVGRVTGVMGRKDDYAGKVVVNAAGCDSAALAASAGVQLPVVVSKRRLLFTQRIDKHILKPCLAVLEKAWGGKQLQEGHIYMAYIGEGAEKLSDYEFTEKSVELGLEILPLLRDTQILRLQQGYYDMTPDGNPVLGGVEGLTGYYHMTGFSGHGFMLSPAIGRAMAQLISGKEPFVDIAPWGLGRFSHGFRREELVL